MICFSVDFESRTCDGRINNEEFHRLVKLLKEKDIKATFFVTSDCLKKSPSLFKKLAREGHEIALHGYLHERWDILSLKEKEEKLDKAIAIYKRIFGKNPRGFRAPQFSADFGLIKLLDKKGFLYDSSIVQFPITQAVFFPSRLLLYLKQHFFRTRIRTNRLKICEIAVSSFGLPISMFTLRKLPGWMFGLMTKLDFTFRKDKSLVFLSHSYEFDNNGLKRIEKFFEENKSTKFVTMEDLIE